MEGGRRERERERERGGGKWGGEGGGGRKRNLILPRTAKPVFVDRDCFRLCQGVAEPRVIVNVKYCREIGSAKIEQFSWKAEDGMWKVGGREGGGGGYEKLLELNRNRGVRYVWQAGHLPCK